MLSDELKKQLGTWIDLYPFFESKEWLDLKSKLKPDFQNITPEMFKWFRAFESCNINELKVVWLGLSPYHTTDKFRKGNVADGLCFSTEQINDVPPSLFQLYKGIENDQFNGLNLNMSRHNNLEFLANQGILLLNSALTTTYGSPDTHLEVWKPFVKYVLEYLNKKDRLIFCGFGQKANELLTIIDKEKHLVLEREHPAASSYRGDYWKHDKMFTKIDIELIEQGKNGILWDKYYYDLEKPPF